MRIILLSNKEVPQEKLGGVTLLFETHGKVASVVLSHSEKNALYTALGYDYSFGATQEVEVVTD